MPRYSKRIHFLRSLEHLLPLAMLLEDDPSPNSPYELYRLLHNATTRSRYLERGHRYTMNRDKGWRARIDTLHRKTDRDFRRLLRVDKAEFQYIYPSLNRMIYLSLLVDVQSTPSVSTHGGPVHSGVRRERSERFHGR